MRLPLLSSLKEYLLHPPIIGGIVFWLSVNLYDIYSSLVNNGVANVYEANVFMADLQGHFMLLNGLVIKLYGTIGVIFVSVCLWYGDRKAYWPAIPFYVVGWPVLMAALGNSIILWYSHHH